jgi:hypothetical protein
MKSNKKCVFNVNFQYNHKQVPTAYFSMMFNIHKHISFNFCGGAHLKKLRRAEGGAKNFGVFRVKNHDFTPKNIFFPIFFWGGGRVRPPLDPPLRYNLGWVSLRLINLKAVYEKCKLTHTRL